jgi:hypothetical protein
LDSVYGNIICYNVIHDISTNLSSLSGHGIRVKGAARPSTGEPTWVVYNNTVYGTTEGFYWMNFYTNPLGRPGVILKNNL